MTALAKLARDEEDAEREADATSDEDDDRGGGRRLSSAARPGSAARLANLNGGGRAIFFPSQIH